jgi:phosphoribosylformimino-5-aminoimidazole carboxamide ribotide isomerase
MILFPAIDLYDGKAVRLYKGDYAQMTVYSHDPMEIAQDFEAQGAKFVHLVDLEGAKDGTTPNLDIVKRIAKETALFTEIGGGIRSMETVRAYLENGVDRVILGTAAVNDEAFLKEAIAAYGDRIAVGVDIKDGFVAIKGWTENSQYDCFDFCRKMVDLGVKYLICTDISKDGAMQGTNRELYRQLSEKFPVNITASGGVSTLDDIRALRQMELYGAIIGKAYYSGAINLTEALEAAK